jgi:polyisoprenoid-binding protein YceI
MKRIRSSSLLVTALVLALPALADTYKARPGSSVKIDGTSTVHDWTVESKLVGGSMELKGDLTKPGKVDAAAKTIISVRSIKSDKKAMDDIMYAALKVDEHPRIEFTLKELTAKGDLKFDAKGDLSVAGVSKEVSFPVTMEKAEGDMMIVKGVLNTKMTDFGIQPPAPQIPGNPIKTGDDIKITFEWPTKKQ